jgi:hypothetical protein
MEHRISGRGGWRLPAPEIERTVASAAHAVLGVRQASQRSADRVVHAQKSSGADHGETTVEDEAPALTTAETVKWLYSE